MLPICFTHSLALLSHYFKSRTCVCSILFCNILSPKALYGCVGTDYPTAQNGALIIQLPDRLGTSTHNGVCCYFRPKIFSPGDHVRYHSHTLGAGPPPNGPQFCHIRYIHPGGVTPVDHESAQLSRLEAVAVESPKSPESPDVTPMALQPQTPAQPTQPTMAANVPRKRSLQSTLCLLEAQSHYDRRW